MLGSIADAEDVVQDAFLRWNAADRAGVVEPNAFIARRASRLCLGLMKSASARSRPGHRDPRRQVRGVDSVRDALHHGSPDRLGHAIAAFTDEAVLADHPMARAHQLGLSYSTNTDDPGRLAAR